MLLKLIKTKLRSQRTLFWITLCAMPTLAALLGFSCYMTDYYDKITTSISAVITMSGVGLSLISTLSLFGLFFAMSFAIMYSVYEMYGTHNAYLYFTLPIKRKTVYHANIISQLIQFAVLYCIAAISAVIFWLITIPLFKDDFLEAIDTYIKIGDIFGGLLFFWDNKALYYFLGVTSKIASGLWSLVSLQLACVFGCSIAKKHKILGSVFAMFLISVITGMISLLLPILSLFIEPVLPAGSYWAFAVIMECLSILLTFAFSVVGYFLAIRRLEKKFDVE